jgi:hypothetical protein
MVPPIVWLSATLTRRHRKESLNIDLGLEVTQVSHPDESPSALGLTRRRLITVTPFQALHGGLLKI